MLGTFLRQNNINVCLSQTINHSSILQMFKLFDTNNSGYLNFEQFTVAFNCFRHYTVLHLNSHCSTNNDQFQFQTPDNIPRPGIITRETSSDEEYQKMSELFHRLAVRRIKFNPRDRIYFSDFYDHLTSYRDRFAGKTLRISQIDHPLHFVFEYLVNGLYVYYFQFSQMSKQELMKTSVFYFILPKNTQEWQKTLDNDLLKYFYFLLGLGKETQLLKSNKQTIITTIIYALNKMEEYRSMLLNNHENYDTNAADNVTSPMVMSHDLEAHTASSIAISPGLKAIRSISTDVRQDSVNTHDHNNDISVLDNCYNFVWKLLRLLLNTSSIQNQIVSNYTEFDIYTKKSKTIKQFDIAVDEARYDVAALMLNFWKKGESISHVVNNVLGMHRYENQDITNVIKSCITIECIDEIVLALVKYLVKRNQENQMDIIPNLEQIVHQCCFGIHLPNPGE